MVGEAYGGLLLIFGYGIVLLVSAAIPIFVSLPACFHVKYVNTTFSKSYAGNFSQAVKEEKNAPVMLSILLTSTFLLTVDRNFDEYIPPLFLEEGFAISTIAFLSIPVFSAQGLGEYPSDRFHHLQFRSLINLMLISTFLLVIPAYMGGVASVIAVMSFFFIFGLAGTIVESKL
ncbi:MAG: hypothetical protein ACJAX5_000258 [Patiriisocius sp.]|jgi:hypothetical protein